MAEEDLALVRASPPVPVPPLRRFLDEGGRPGDVLDDVDLLRVGGLALRAWRPAQTQARRNELALRAIRRYLAAAGGDLDEAVEPRAGEVASLWAADLLRDRDLLDDFVARLDDPLRAVLQTSITVEV